MGRSVNHDEEVTWVAGRYGYYSCTRCRAKRRVTLSPISTHELTDDSGWMMRSMITGCWEPQPECARQPGRVEVPRHPAEVNE
jgi:hypothetical protein